MDIQSSLKHLWKRFFFPFEYSCHHYWTSVEHVYVGLFLGNFVLCYAMLCIFTSLLWGGNGELHQFVQTKKKKKKYTHKTLNDQAYRGRTGDYNKGSRELVRQVFPQWGGDIVHHIYHWTVYLSICQDHTTLFSIAL